jgi:hypothetical protein
MKIIFTLLFLLLNQLALAGELDGVIVKRIMHDRSQAGKVFIELDRKQTSPASCHNNHNWQYVLDISDNYGKAMYSTLLSLHMSGKQALFRGTQECTLFGSVETLGRIEIK